MAVLHRSSRSPLTHRDYQRLGCEERFGLLQPSSVKQSEFQQVELVYEAGIDGMGRGDELDSKKYKRPRSPV